MKNRTEITKEENEKWLKTQVDYLTKTVDKLKKEVISINVYREMCRMNFDEIGKTIKLIIVAVILCSLACLGLSIFK